MRRLSAFIIMFIGIIVLLGAMNQSFINALKQNRYFSNLNGEINNNKLFYNRVFMRSDRWRYGDLYGISFLHEYKFALKPFKKYSYSSDTLKHKRVLYIIGDSYLADKTLSHAFRDFDNVIFLDRRFSFGPISLDTTIQNYLVLEFAERNLPGYNLNTSTEIRWSAEDIRQRAYLDQVAASGKAPANVLPHGFHRLTRALFNKDLNRNLELLLFDDRLFSPFKEIKASFNYDILGRLPPDVAVSTDKKRLLMNITVDTSFRESAFRTFRDQDIANIAFQLFVARQYYRDIGFRNVLLSIIPNPVSIYDQQRSTYNHLLERIERKVQMPVISVYKQFRDSGSNLYYYSDSHWNPTGLDVWVNETNRVLKVNLK